MQLVGWRVWALGPASWEGNHPAKLLVEPCRRGGDASALGRAGEVAQAPAFKAFSPKDTQKGHGCCFKTNPQKLI